VEDVKEVVPKAEIADKVADREAVSVAKGNE
jgi:hypothetical protein